MSTENVTQPTVTLDADTVETISHLVDELSGDLLSTSHVLHANPELSFEEHAAMNLLATRAEQQGFTVERGAYGIPTSFEAIKGTGRFRVVICCEYDALPGVGHACGHNTMAAMALGAALVLGELADLHDLTVVLLGAIAEEHGGGKALLMEQGAFEEATISLMAHAASGDIDKSCGLYSTQAVDRFKVTYTGRGAHAAAAPFKAINAADAATLAQVAIGLLRQQLEDGIRLSAFVEQGGEATNIVPALTVLQAEVRAPDSPQLDEVKGKMLKCFEGAAIATSCGWKAERTEPRYDELKQDPRIAPVWDEALRALGRKVDVVPRGQGGGSTDMGNVSLVVPSIHPSIAFLGQEGVPHTAEFAADAATEAADQAVIDGAKALALSVLGLDDAARESLLADQAARPAGFTKVPVSPEV
jgi:amidohydrolase